MAAAVTVDRDVCIGSGVCVGYAPGTFTQDESATAVVLPRADDPPDAVETAVQACPTGALRLVQEENA